MTDQLISFETAKLAKEKGFKEQTQLMYSASGDLVAWIDSYCLAPTQSLLQKWLREKYEINIFINCEMNISSMEVDWFKYNYKLYLKRNAQFVSHNRFDTYEEALEQSLIEALKLIK